MHLYLVMTPTTSRAADIYLTAVQTSREFSGLQMLYPLYIDSLRVGYVRNRNLLNLKYLFRSNKNMCFIIGARVCLTLIGAAINRIWTGRWQLFRICMLSLSVCLGHARLRLPTIRVCSSLILTLSGLILNAAAIVSVSAHIITILLFHDRHGIVKNLEEALASGLDVFTYTAIHNLYPSESQTFG